MVQQLLLLLLWQYCVVAVARDQSLYSTVLPYIYYSVLLTTVA